MLLNLGTLFNLAGDPERAIAATRQALQVLRHEEAPRLFLCARYNLARYLTEAGQFGEAAGLLAADESLYRSFPEPWTQLRVAWLAGKIAVGQGDFVKAEWCFMEARDGFAAAGNGFDAAMVCVEDLALLYLRQGRTADVRRLAEEMLPIFAAQDIHREAAAALVLFQDAARRDELTARFAREVAAYLKGAKGDPSLRFGVES